MKISRRNLFAAGGSTAMIAMMGSASSSLAQSAASQTSLDLSTTPDTLGAKARQAMIDIFRKKDATGVDRYFGESFIQHDPTLADGLAGMKSFAAEVASSPAADITIYRTLVDGDFVLLHSRYEGVGRYGTSAIAFDLFRFEHGKIVEHWGDRSRRRLLICQVARKSTVPLRSLIMRRRRPIGPWYEHTGRRSWSHCVSIGSKSSLKALTMRSTPRKSEMELLG
jgi:predicted SnoaL-like aldol condensation-catalyzing enzyme